MKKSDIFCAIARRARIATRGVSCTYRENIEDVKASSAYAAEHSMSPDVWWHVYRCGMA